MTASSDTGTDVRSASRRTRRRRAGFVVPLLLIAAGVGGTAYGLHSFFGGSGGPSATTSAGHYQSKLGWSIRYPRAMHVEHSAAVSGNGHAGVDETTFASFRSKLGVRHRISSAGESISDLPPRTASGRFPSNGVALRVEDWTNPFPLLGRVLPPATRLPLHLSQFRMALRGSNGGTDARLLSHSLVIVGRPHDHYNIYVWIGPRVPMQQRALLERMIASISFRRVPATS